MSELYEFDDYHSDERKHSCWYSVRRHSTQKGWTESSMITRSKTNEAAAAAGVLDSIDASMDAQQNNDHACWISP